MKISKPAWLPVLVLALVLCIIIVCAGCEMTGAMEPVSPGPDSSVEEIGESDPPLTGQSPDADPAEQSERDNEEVRSLLEKGSDIRNLSYIAKFVSSGNEFVYEYYKRDNLTKMVIREGDSQSISVCDGKATVYYSLPEKIGYTMFEAGDDMGLVPSTDALLNGDVYHFIIMGEENFSGYLCQVVETEDEFGVLKIWISKTLGLPIKYIGADDIGWYSLELTEIQLGEPLISLFTIPSDIRL